MNFNNINKEPKIIVVMPVANEQGTMQSIIDQVLGLPYDNLYLYPVIDGYSKDDTEAIIRKAEMETGRVRCVFYENSTGVVSCYLEGFKYALLDDADFIIEMDGGGSHSPMEIPMFIDKLKEGYDCVWGSRFVQGGLESKVPFYRRILSSGGTILANIVLKTKLKDMTSGFEGFQREVLENLNLKRFLSTGHMYQTEMRFYCRKLNTIEVPIHYTGGESSLKWKSVKEALCILFQLQNHERYMRKIGR